MVARSGLTCVMPHLKDFLQVRVEIASTVPIINPPDKAVIRPISLMPSHPVGLGKRLAPNIDLHSVLVHFEPQDKLKNKHQYVSVNYLEVALYSADSDCHLS